MAGEYLVSSESEGFRFGGDPPERYIDRPMVSASGYNSETEKRNGFVDAVAWVEERTTTL